MSDCCGLDKEKCEISTTCPRCKERGQQVARETVGAMAELTVPAAPLSHESFRYCTTQTCPVVYYADGEAVLETRDLRVPVNVKDSGLDVPLCYCFGHTRRSITEEFAATGKSTASAKIAGEIKAGHCACEVKNPSGRCCLGEVRAYEKAASERESLALLGMWRCP